jgi:hypothetical protein
MADRPTLRLSWNVPLDERADVLHTAFVDVLRGEGADPPRRHRRPHQGAMGQAAGTAAALCARERLRPRT